MQEILSYLSLRREKLRVAMTFRFGNPLENDVTFPLLSPLMHKLCHTSAAISNDHGVNKIFKHKWKSFAVIQTPKKKARD